MLEWNLDEKKKISFNIFTKKFLGKKFMIKSGKYKFEFLLHNTMNLFTNKILKSNILELKSIDHIISINFDDTHNINTIPQKIPHTIYISSISKKEGVISGSESIKFAINIAKHIKEVKRMYLYDGASVKCADTDENSYDLSLYKLLVKNETFYNKFGFYLQYKSKNIQKILEKYAKQVSQYKNNKIIYELTKIINELEKKNLKLPIKLYSCGLYIYDSEINNYMDINKYICYYNGIIRILNYYKNKTFGKTIEILQKENCNMFQLFFNYFDKSNYSSSIFTSICIFKINNKKYNLKFMKKINKLQIIRSGVYNGYYVKKL